MSLSQFSLHTPDDIAAFFSAMTGMVPGYRQMSRGLATIHYTTVDLMGVSLLWCRNPAHALWRDEMTDNGGLQIGFVVDATAEVRVRGSEVSTDHALLWIAGEEMEYLHKGRVETLEIWVSPEIVAQYGWLPSGKPLQRVSQGVLQGLTAVAREATHAAAHGVFPQNTHDLAAHRARILNVLEPALDPWLHDNNGKADAANTRAHYHVFNEAEQQFLARREEVQNMDALAAALGVSKRSLFLAFRKTIGVGPRRYFEVQKLHMLQKRLLDARPNTATVTQLATELDFSDMGRVAANYRELFRENPSQTLARRR
ncbi:MAG: helix-turn-helix domain-containing protein [Arenibacterium sp.]